MHKAVHWPRSHSITHHSWQWIHWAYIFNKHNHWSKHSTWLYCTHSILKHHPAQPFNCQTSLGDMILCHHMIPFNIHKWILLQLSQPSTWRTTHNCNHMDNCKSCSLVTISNTSKHGSQHLAHASTSISIKHLYPPMDLTTFTSMHRTTDIASIDR